MLQASGQQPGRWRRAARIGQVGSRAGDVLSGSSVAIRVARLAVQSREGSCASSGPCAGTITRTQRSPTVLDGFGYPAIATIKLSVPAD